MSNNNAPKLTDESALQRHRSRVDCNSDAMFLQHLAFDEMQERLMMVNRTFNSVAVVSPFPKIWSEIHENASHIAPGNRLHFDAAPYDLIIHAMDLHWANDPVGQIIQCARALKPDGLFLACFFGGQTLHELRAALTQAEVALLDGISPRVAPMTEVRDAGGLLQRAGLGLPVADVSHHCASYRDLTSLGRDLARMGESNALAARIRTPTRKGLFDLAQGYYRRDHPARDGGILATFDIVFLAGWAPHPTQQKPLKPGSATHSFAAALNTKELPASD